MSIRDEPIAPDVKTAIAEACRTYKQQYGPAITTMGEDFESDMHLSDVLLEIIEEHVEEPEWIAYIAEALSNTARIADGKPDGFVYVLQSGQHYKIGKTKRLDSRIMTLKIQLPMPVFLLHAFPCQDYSQSELELHALLHEWRLNGEWFGLPNEVLYWITQIKLMSKPVVINRHSSLAVANLDLPTAILNNGNWSTAFLECQEAMSRFS